MSEKLSSISDPRKNRHYKIEEIVFAGIAMFMFKCGSRNAMDNIAKKTEFEKNYRKVFGHRLPDMDTVSGIFEKLPPEDFEKLKQQLVSQLLEKRVFDKWRFKNHFIVAIDGTGVVSFDHEHCPQCLSKVSKNGKKSWFHNVLEAKLVTDNGFSISLCTEWIENPGKEYDKQDCERRAFERLANKLKTQYPRLAMCLCADGLYPNNTFFGICKNNNWKYIVTLKDGNLKGLWKKIRLQNREGLVVKTQNKNTQIHQQYQWVNTIELNGNEHNWIELNETISCIKQNKNKKQRFVHLTNIEITQNEAVDISQTGRLRWKIENQGFDIQKNHGYNICHQYCQKSYNGLKNFYQCCQIAHMFNQLTELSKKVQAMLVNKTSLVFLWDYLKWSMALGDIDVGLVNVAKSHRTQIQFAT